MTSRSRIAGYTLVEVLVAFVILALTLTVLLQIFSSGLRNVSISSEYARALIVAESRLAAAGLSESLQPGEEHGIEGGKYTWTQIITEYSPTQPASGRAARVKAFHVAVAVEWADSGRARQVNLSSIYLAEIEEFGS